jgi:methyl-accepting chemotaxis protein
VTTAAKRGDLTQRIPLDGKSGPIAELCEGVNQLMETTSVIFERRRPRVRRAGRRRPVAAHHRDYEGTFGQVKDDANATSEKLAASSSRTWAACSRAWPTAT